MTRIGRIVAAGGVTVGGLVVLGASPASAAPDVCVATNGVQRHQSGTATCETYEASGIVAVAVGDGSEASVSPYIESDQARAVAIGSGATASVFYGFDAMALAVGDQSTADVYHGGGLQARVIGEGSTAIVNDQGGSSVMVVGDDSYGGAQIGGVLNDVRVIGDDSSGEAFLSSQNSISIRAHGATVQLTESNTNDVTVTTDGCTILLDGAIGETTSC